MDTTSRFSGDAGCIAIAERSDPVVGEVVSWRVTERQQLLDTTALGSRGRSYTRGLRTWSATVDAVWHTSAVYESITTGEVEARFEGGDFGVPRTGRARIEGQVHVGDTDSDGRALVRIEMSGVSGLDNST